MGPRRITEGPAGVRYDYRRSVEKSLTQLFQAFLSLRGRRPASIGIGTLPSQRTKVTEASMPCNSTQRLAVA
jgi:hypothetical protein